ncbi:MAG TPA: class I SAM-dependent methyltransferase [Verrucomicrobiae bacterium]|jgi:23S rRNA (cytosine1962-C5)-methyltransferase|nr:class I SAM-dependent methyltransferase [Verrucomicrobiae bacterium]
MNRAAANKTAATRLRLRITAAAETIVRSGHPWLFADSIHESNRAGQLGELAVIYDRKDKFLAVGLFDPDSPIHVRILHAGKPQTIDSIWWNARLEKALAIRRDLFDAQTTGYRLIHGESDGWPGLVLDNYDSTLVLKIYTAAWLPRLEETVSLFKEKISCERIVLRLSRNIQSITEKQFQLRDGQILFGSTPVAPVIFTENGIRFEADVLRGQKTGFFLDQRENRAEVEKLSRGRKVLNAFSFSGGFSVYAARGGAVSVTDLDISAHALESAKRNFALNQNFPGVANCRHEIVQADCFDWLEKTSDKFDLIVLDPPSLAKRATEREGAIRAYERLNSLGIARLSRDGVLVAGSCSAHVSAPEFFDAVRRAAVKSGRKFTELKTLRHPPDHPATFKEAEYLKVIYLKFST